MSSSEEMFRDAVDMANLQDLPLDGGSISANVLSDFEVAAVLAEVKRHRLVTAQYPEDINEWANVKPTIDKKGTLWMFGEQIMMPWEEPLAVLFRKMALLGVKKVGGDVLDVGFGLGYTSEAIRDSIAQVEMKKLHPTFLHEGYYLVPMGMHYIVEANRYRAEAARKFAKNAGYPVTVVEGFWQDVIGEFKDESLGGMICDAFPLEPDDMNLYNIPLLKEAHRLLRRGGVCASFLDWPSSREGVFPDFVRERIAAAGFDPGSKSVILPVSPPSYCRYWPFDTIVAPFLVKE